MFRGMRLVSPHRVQINTTIRDALFPDRLWRLNVQEKDLIEAL